MRNNMILFSYKGGCEHVLMCLKEELAWVTDKWPWSIYVKAPLQVMY